MEKTTVPLIEFTVTDVDGVHAQHLLVDPELPAEYVAEIFQHMADLIIRSIHEGGDAA